MAPRITSGSITVGLSKCTSLKELLWQAVPSCDPENCPLKDKCVFLKDKPNDFCEIQRRYINSVAESLRATMGEIEGFDSMKVGLFLIPLFQQLITLKIEAYGVGSSVMLGTKMHPIFKEMRSVMHEINSLLKDLKVNKGKRTGFLDGDDDYYESLMENGETPL